MEVKEANEFKQSLDMSATNTSMDGTVDIKTVGVEYQLEDEKMEAKQTVTLCININVYESIQLELITEAHNVDTYKQEYTLERLIGADKDSIKIERSKEFPLAIKEINRITSKCKLTENKAMDDKLALRGSVVFYIYYIDEEGESKIAEVSGEEFTHFIHVSGAQPSMSTLVETNISDIKIEMTPDSMGVQVSSVLDFSIKVLSNETMKFVTDVNILKDQSLKDASITIYMVQPNDTLFGIAKKYGVPLHQIVEENKEKIQDPDQIEPGQKILIP